VSFDEIAKEKIFESISSSKLSDKTYVRNSYNKLVDMYGRMISLSELYDGKELDPRAVITAFGSLNEIQASLRGSGVDRLDEIGSKALKTITTTFSTGLRAEELVILRELLKSKSVEKRCVVKILEEEFMVDKTNVDSLNSAISVLDSSYRNKSEQFINVTNEVIVRSDYFDKTLESHEFRYYVEDAVECGLKIYSNEYKGKVKDGFRIYNRYKRLDVMRLLNWKQFIPGLNIGGYIMNKESMPIFITYNKDENITSVVEYDDKFLDLSTMQWMSKHSRTMENNEIQKIINSKELGVSNYLFVKRSDSDDNADFYYLGKVHVVDAANDTDVDESGKKYNVVRFKLKLEQSVRSDVYEYLTA
jgi:hypothetical protein